MHRWARVVAPAAVPSHAKGPGCLQLHSRDDHHAKVEQANIARFATILIVSQRLGHGGSGERAGLQVNDAERDRSLGCSSYY